MKWYFTVAIIVVIAAVAIELFREAIMVDNAALTRLREANFIQVAYALPSEDQIVIDYCIQHADSILLGSNPVEDLVSTGLVSDTYSNKTCSEVKTQSEIDESFSETMQDLIVVP